MLSAPDQRARGAVILTSEAIAGALYFWPEENTGIVRFLNLYSSIEMCVAIVDTAGTIEEFLTLDAGDDSSIEPTNPIGSAIAFPADRFKDIEIDIGDRVVLPRELRPLIWSSE